jgi:hypothetical protein
VSSVDRSGPVNRDKYLKIRVEIDGQVFEEDLVPQVFVQPDIDGLNEALAENPKRFAWWATLENIASEEHALLENQLRKLETDKKEALQRVEGRLFAEFHMKGGKVDEIKGRVTIHPDRTQVWDDWAAREADLRDKVTRAAFKHDQMRTGRKSTQERKDSLLEIARNIRSEMEQRLRPGQPREDRITLADAQARLKNYFNQK